MDSQDKTILDFIVDGKTNEEIIAVTGLSHEQIDTVRAGQGLEDELEAPVETEEVEEETSRQADIESESEQAPVENTLNEEDDK